MDVKHSRGPLRFLARVPDPRAANVTFLLVDLLTITLLAVLSRCEDYDEIALWAGQRADWLRSFLDLPDGRTPHADTFERVFRRIDPAALERCFVTFTRGVAEASRGRLIALDGKTLRGSLDGGGRKAAIHLVHAWDQHNHLVLGQWAVADKSNQITAVPELLKLLDLEGAVVSLDAMHCQKQTARAIRDAGADYLLAVKGNQKGLHEDIELFFDDAIEQADPGLAHAAAEPDAQHGRLDERRVWAGDDVAWLRRRHPDWPDLAGVVCVEGTRLDLRTGESTTTRRHYLTSLDPREVGPARLLELVRGHWGVENNLHWCLDVCFGDDASRVRKDHGPQNIARIRRLALNLLRRNPPPRGKHASPSDRISLKRRRLLCLMNDDYLLQTLMQAE